MASSVEEVSYEFGSLFAVTVLGSLLAYLYTVNTVGATPYVGEPRLLVSLLTPEDLRQEFTGAELLADDTLRHPLLHY